MHQHPQGQTAPLSVFPKQLLKPQVFPGLTSGTRETIHRHRFLPSLTILDDVDIFCLGFIRNSPTMVESQGALVDSICIAFGVLSVVTLSLRIWARWFVVQHFGIDDCKVEAPHPPKDAHNITYITPGSR